MKFLTPRHKNDVKRMWQLVPLLLIISFLVAHISLWPLNLYYLSLIGLCLILMSPKSWRKLNFSNRTIYPFWQVLITMWLIQISIMAMSFSLLALSPTWITPPYTPNTNYLSQVAQYYIHLPLFPWGMSLGFATLISYACTKKDTVAWVDIWPSYHARSTFLCSNLSFINSRLAHLSMIMTLLVLILLSMMSQIFPNLRSIPNQNYSAILAISFTQLILTHKTYSQHILRLKVFDHIPTTAFVLLITIFISFIFFIAQLTLNALSTTLTFLQLSIGSNLIHWLSPPQLFNVWTLILASITLGLALIFNRVIVYLSHGYKPATIILAGLTLPGGLWAMNQWQLIDWPKLLSYPTMTYQVIFLISLLLLFYILSHKKISSSMTMPYISVKEQPKFRHRSKFLKIIIIGTSTYFTLTYLGGMGLLALIETTILLPPLIIGAPALLFLSWHYCRRDE